MAGQLDAKMRAVAETLIERFGKVVDWTSYDDVPDPATGTVSRTANSHQPTISPPVGPNQSYVAGQVIEQGEFDVMLAASAITFTPKVGDEVDIDSVIYTVVKVDWIYSGELVAAYKCTVRR